MNRPSREEYYMSIAELASMRSTCLSRRVGAIIVKEDNPISFGFNGPARGVKHCSELGGCRRRAMPDYKSGAYLELCPASHAEQNAIAFAARHGISTVGATVYVNTFPCKDCMNSLINAGISTIIYDSDYNAELSSNIVKDTEINIRRYEGRNIKNILNDFNYVTYNDFLENLEKDDKIKIIKELAKDLSKDELSKIIK
ncbi:MAG: dCMP deaminase family protein [Firmicutes bacterium]|nr:dCMP deaminase family protein [Bacillota bacterium]